MERKYISKKGRKVRNIRKENKNILNHYERFFESKKKNFTSPYSTGLENNGNIFQKREEKLEILEKKIKIFLIILEDFSKRKRKILHLILQNSKTMERKYISKKGRRRRGRRRRNLLEAYVSTSVEFLDWRKEGEIRREGCQPAPYLLASVMAGEKSHPRGSYQSSRGSPTLAQRLGQSHPKVSREYLQRMPASVRLRISLGNFAAVMRTTAVRVENSIKKKEGFSRDVDREIFNTSIDI